MASGIDLSGAVVLVTGGTGGIGSALADVGRNRGATVVTADLPGTDADLTVDVTDRASVQRAVDDTIAEHGRVDVVIANAGIAIAGLTEDLSPDDWDRTIDVNLRGVVHTVTAAYPHLTSQGSGSIVMIASLAGLLPVPLLLPYGATKAAVVSLASGLRAEAARHGVGVTVVCPGPVETTLIDSPANTRGVDVRRLLVRAAGKPITATRLADDVYDAVERNRRLVAPGQAGVLGRVQRLSPALVARVVALNLGRELRAARA